MPIKKAIVIIMTVAILGALTEVTNHKIVSGNATSFSSTQTVAATEKVAAPAASPSTQPKPSEYKDGTYTGSSMENPYGTIEVAAVISGGKITDIKFLQLPNQEGRSREVSNFSAPLLREKALAKQSANIDFVTGATDTSMSFQHSLQAALDQAKP